MHCAMVKVGINGFGRIGRTTFRYAWDMPELEIVAVNELVGGAETAAYLVKYDSVHGTWPKACSSSSADSFTVDGRSVSFSEHEDFTQVDWAAKGVELVIDCTGKFLTVAALQPENSASLMVLETGTGPGLRYCGYRRHINVESGDLPAVVDATCRDLGLTPEATVLIADNGLEGLGEGFAGWCPTQPSQMCAAPLRSLMSLPEPGNCLLLTRQDREVCVVGLAKDDGSA